MSTAAQTSQRSAAGDRLARWRGFLGGPTGVALAATLLTVAMAAPVLRHPTTLLFGSEIVGRHQAPFIVISQFESAPAPSVYTQPVTDFLGMALAWLLGNGVAALNLVVLASFPLAALFAWLLAHDLTRSRAAAWVAGLAYAFAPFHVAQAAYHPHGAQIQWLPLYLLALWRCTERADGGRLALLAVATPLVLLSNFYYGLMAAVLTPVALLGRWLAGPPVGREPRAAGLRSTILALGGLAVLGLGFVVLWAPAALDSPSSLAWPRQDLTSYSARWWSYLVPPVGHPLFGAAVDRFWAADPPAGLLSQQITLGAGLLGLALLAVGLWLRGERRYGLRHAPELALVAGAAFFCSLPPEWRLGEWTLPRPSALLYEIVPMFRAYSRFGVVVLLATAILAGSAAAALLRGSRRQRLTAVALLVLATVELAPLPPWRRRDVLPTAAHRWLSGQSGVRALDCGRADDPAVRSAAAFFDGDLTFLPPGEDCGDPGLPAALAARGINHLVVRREGAVEAWLERAGPPPGLAAVRVFDDARVLAVEAGAESSRLTFAGGFHWREYKDKESYRWMGARGSLNLDHDGPGPIELTLELTVHAFPGPREVEASLDGRSIGRITVGPEPEPRSLGPFLLPPGRHLLTLRSLTAATVPDDVLGNGDRRPISVALWGWRWIEVDPPAALASRL